MVKVSIEVHSGTARFMVGVQARDIQQALSIAQTRYHAKVATVNSRSNLRASSEKSVLLKRRSLDDSETRSEGAPGEQ